MRENANHNGFHAKRGLCRPPDAALIFKRGSADVMEEQAPDQESHSERGWVEGVQQGDAAAFEALFRTYYDELYGFAWRYVSIPEVAEISSRACSSAGAGTGRYDGACRYARTTAALAWQRHRRAAAAGPPERTAHPVPCLDGRSFGL